MAKGKSRNKNKGKGKGKSSSKNEAATKASETAGESQSKDSRLSEETRNLPTISEKNEAAGSSAASGTAGALESKDSRLSEETRNIQKEESLFAAADNQPDCKRLAAPAVEAPSQSSDYQSFPEYDEKLATVQKYSATANTLNTGAARKLPKAEDKGGIPEGIPTEVGSLPRPKTGSNQEPTGTIPEEAVKSSHKTDTRSIPKEEAVKGIPKTDDAAGKDTGSIPKPEDVGSSSGVGGSKTGATPASAGSTGTLPPRFTPTLLYPVRPDLLYGSPHYTPNSSFSPGSANKTMLTQTTTDGAGRKSVAKVLKQEPLNSQVDPKIKKAFEDSKKEFLNRQSAAAAAARAEGGVATEGTPLLGDENSAAGLTPPSRLTDCAGRLYSVVDFNSKLSCFSNLTFVCTVFLVVIFTSCVLPKELVGGTGASAAIALASAIPVFILYFAILKLGHCLAKRRRRALGHPEEPPETRV